MCICVFAAIQEMRSSAVVIAVCLAFVVAGSVSADDNEFGAIGIDFGLEQSVLGVIRSDGRLQIVATEPTYVSFTEQAGSGVSTGK